MDLNNLNPDDMEINPDLASSLDKERGIVQEDVIEFVETSAAKLAKNYPDAAIPSIHELTIPSLDKDEDYLRLIASSYYKRLDTKAHSYIKLWCQVNEFYQVWSNPKTATLKRNLQYKSQFIPMTYGITLRHKSDNLRDFVLIELMHTATEARIQGAKRIGFIDSLQYKAIHKEFAAPILQVLKDNPKYMKELKEFLIIQEYRAQIERARFVPKDLKDKWDKEQVDKINSIGSIV